LLLYIHIDNNSKIVTIYPVIVAPSISERFFEDIEQ
jgi:hypothetical protein